MATQNARLLHWLETHDGCTTAEVTDNLKIYRLSERIRELEALGFQISHTPETTENGARVIRYRLGARKAVPQAPCRPRLSSSGLAERLDSTNAVSPSVAGTLNETDSPIKPAGTAHDAPSPCYDKQGRLICYAVSE